MENIANCVVCAKLPYMAVTCHTCSINYCQECYQSNLSVCRVCKVKNSCVVNHEIRRVAERCGECLGIYLKGEDHRLTCTKSLSICQFCSKTCKRDELSLHYFNFHYKRILERFGDPVFRIK